MFRKVILVGGVVSALAYGDFSYEQTSRITGGAMQSMMRVAGAFSKSAREPMKSTIMVKGDRMATITGDERIDVIDLNAETFTEINLKKKTYSVVTFAEMARAIEKAAAEARKRDGGNEANVTMKADVKHTGATRNIAGMDTKQSIVTLTTEIENKEEGAKGQMSFVMDMWLAPQIAGYDEIRNFYQKMASKIAWSPLGGMAGAMMAGQAKGMSELIKEMSKLEGVPVLQVVRVGGLGPGGQGAQAGAGAPPPQQEEQAPPPNVGDAAGRAAAGAAVSRTGRLGGLAGGLGGFGGFGRKKKQQQEEQQQAPPPAPAQQQQPAQQQAAAGGAQASLMEITSELSGFSSASVDASRFEVPGGFKKVDSERYK